MLIPTKHEFLDTNVIVLGADILFFLKKRSYNMEDLFQSIKKNKDLSLDKFYDVLTFLWLCNYITVVNEQINLI